MSILIRLRDRLAEAEAVGDDVLAAMLCDRIVELSPDEDLPASVSSRDGHAGPAWARRPGESRYAWYERLGFPEHVWRARRR